MGQPTDATLEQAYKLAKERYAAMGVDTDAALEKLATIPISLHCWQGDDVRGFESCDRPHDPLLDFRREGRVDALEIHLCAIDALRFQEDFVAGAVWELDNLGLQRRAVARSLSGDQTIVVGALGQMLLDNAVGRLIGM